MSKLSQPLFELYMHGPKNICRNCGKHVDQHSGQYAPAYGLGKFYVCPREVIAEGEGEE